MDRQIVTKGDIEELVHNKDELVYFFAFTNRLFLPPKNFLTHRYLAMLLSGEKRLLRVDEVVSNWIPPCSPYITVRDIYNDLLDKVPGFETYMPILTEHQNPPREYFFKG